VRLVLGQDFGEEVHCTVAVVQALGQDTAPPKLELGGALRILGVAKLLGEERLQVPPPVGHLVEPLQSGESLLASRLEVEHLPIGGDGGVHVRQDVFV